MRLIDAPTINRWIPVSEMLPKLGEDVLICTSNGTIHVAWLGNDNNDWWFASDEYGYEEFIKNIIAWMPLPPAYNPKSTE